ncbi:MAG TPA: hypothetical protein IGR15_00125 [Synechococcus sp. M44_DOE_062]|nr:hypothetical protein [Synechococcus sp. M44_DOE_062]
MLNQESSRQQLFLGLGLPQRLNWQGQLYRRAERATADTRRFVTDSTPIQAHGIHWKILSGENPFDLTDQPTLPDPPPERLFLLHRHCQFVPQEL